MEANSAEQLGKFLVGTPVGSTVVGLGGTPLVALLGGILAGAAYGELWDHSSQTRSAYEKGGLVVPF